MGKPDAAHSNTWTARNWSADAGEGSIHDAPGHTASPHTRLDVGRQRRAGVRRNRVAVRPQRVGAQDAQPAIVEPGVPANPEAAERGVVAR